MSSIGFAEDCIQDREQLRVLWRTCFDAEDAYQQLYFSTRYRPDQTLVFREEGEILGMATLLPCTYRGIFQGRERLYRASYLFAVATLPRARGKQIATKLLQEAERYHRQWGIELAILAPAQADLYPFYQKRGYETWFYRRECCYPPTNSSADGWELRQLHVADYYHHHLRLLGRDAVLWPQDALIFAEGESKLYHGGLYALCQQGKRRAICNLYHYVPEEWIAKELLAEPGESEEQLCSALRGLFPQASWTVRLPAKEDTQEGQPGQKEVPAGMVRWYLPQHQRPDQTGWAYLPFILD